MNDIIDLGSGHSIRFIHDTNDKIVGFFEMHKSSLDLGVACGGIVDIGPQEWSLVSMEPLTIIPSINCYYCDSHGTIINGRWEDNRTPQEIAFWKQKGMKEHSSKLP